ncbi:MAG: LysR family transcriptional regulator [Endozoicomonas sp.]
MQLDFDLNLIKPFMAVFRHQSITRAADELNLTQPAVSRSIRRLEETLGERLFVKQGRGIVPTSKAMSFAGGMQQATQIIHDAVTEQNHLKIFCNEALLFHINHLDVDVVNPPASQTQMLERLRSGQAALALDYVTEKDSSFIIEPLGTSRMVAVASQDNPITHLDEETFYRLPHILHKSTRHGISFFDLLAESPRQRNEKYTAPSNMTMLTLVSSDKEAICSVADILAYRWAEQLKLKIFDIPVAMKSVPYQLVYHRRYLDRSEHCQLREKIKQAITAETVQK